MEGRHGEKLHGEGLHGAELCVEVLQLTDVKNTIL